MTVRGEDKMFEGRKGKKRRKRKGGNVRAIVITNDLPQSPHTCSGDSWKERDFGQQLLSLQSLTGELESSH